MKKLNFLAVVALIITATASCKKDDLKVIPSWNALSITESNSEEYSAYMNLPHFNITFPSQIESDVINYIDGVWQIGGGYYTIVAHNWSSGKLLFKVMRGSNMMSNQIIDPMQPINLQIELSPGEYHFSAAILDERGETPMNIHRLHGTFNRLVVE